MRDPNYPNRINGGLNDPANGRPGLDTPNGRPGLDISSGRPGFDPPNNRYKDGFRRPGGSPLDDPIYGDQGRDMDEETYPIDNYRGMNISE